jgi:hypothetical protein
MSGSLQALEVVHVVPPTLTEPVPLTMDTHENGPDAPLFSNENWSFGGTVIAVGGGEVPS